MHYLSSSNSGLNCGTAPLPPAAALKAGLIVCLGATAARSVFGRDVRVTAERGKILKTDLVQESLVTVHPSALLRVPDPERRRYEWHLFVQDLSIIDRWLVTSREMRGKE